MTYVPPWEYDQSTFAEDMEYYEGTDPDAVLRAYKNFYYSSYGCGWYAWYVTNRMEKSMICGELKVIADISSSFAASRCTASLSDSSW